MGDVNRIDELRIEITEMYLDLLDIVNIAVEQSRNAAQSLQEKNFLQSLENKLILAQSFVMELREEYDPIATANLFTAMDTIKATLVEGSDLPIARRFFGHLIGRQ